MEKINRQEIATEKGKKKRFVFNKAYWACKSIFSLAHHQPLAYLPSPTSA
jgi:hypothetical protein